MNNSTPNIINDIRKVIGMASIGRNARASNFVLDEHQRMDLEDIQRQLFKLFDEILPEWNTINIEVIKYEKDKEAEQK